MSDQDQWRKDLPEGWQGKQSETWDGEVPLKPIVWSVVAVAISVLVAFVFNAWLMSTWNDYRAVGVRQSPLVEARERILPVRPKLQQSPEEELIVMKAELKEHLGSYGWIDPIEQRVYIPVDRAMELVLEQNATVGSIEPPNAPVAIESAEDHTAADPASTDPAASDHAADPAAGDH